MITEQQIQQLIKLLNIALLPNGGKPAVGIYNSSGQDYFVKCNFPNHVMDDICYFFHETPYKIFRKSPSWGTSQCEFSFTPEYEKKVIEAIEKVQS